MVVHMLIKLLKLLVHLNGCDLHRNCHFCFQTTSQWNFSSCPLLVKTVYLIQMSVFSKYCGRANYTNKVVGGRGGILVSLHPSSHLSSNPSVHPSAYQSLCWSIHLSVPHVVSALLPLDFWMCFLLMTLVPVQKLCVNIYMYMHSLY